MSSKGKRASILKKQQPNVEANSTTTSSSIFKGNKKIEFNRKKSIKEFRVGEETDTIWGNSYELSTDGTPSGVLPDLTIANSSCHSLVGEQNKENNTQNLSDNKKDDQRPSPNTTNGSWDLSVTIADDEKRRIRSETSVVFSQSLNTTDRLFVEPFASPEPKMMPEQRSHARLSCGVQAMDISPLLGSCAVSPKKSPRKMIYYNSKEKLYVEINDVPQTTVPVAETVPAAKDQLAYDTCGSASRILYQTPTRAALRSYKAKESDQSSLRGASMNVSETWNSHSQATRNKLQLQQSKLDELANMSSDVDTTLAITNTVAKLLESGPNITIPLATTMELDESITTEDLPTNALARARPSFLPSQHRVDESQNVPQTPSIDDSKHTPEPEPVLGKAIEETNNLEISSPLEGRCTSGKISIENISLINDLQKPPMMEETMHKSAMSIIDVNKSSCSNATAIGNVHSMDFGISSLSLKLLANSPEKPSVNRPTVLRPTLPLTMFNRTDNKTGQTPIANKMSGKFEKKQNCTEKVDQLQQTMNIPEDMQTSFRKDTHELRQRVDYGNDVCSKPLEITYFDRTQSYGSPQFVPQSRPTVAMDDTIEQTQILPSTVCETKLLVVHESYSHNTMEINRGRLEPSVSAKPVRSNSQTINDELDPMRDESMNMDQSLEVCYNKRKAGSVRNTIHENIIMDVSTVDVQHAVKTNAPRLQARKTYYPDEVMRVDTVVVQQDVATKEHPIRKTFYPDETIHLNRMERIDTAKDIPSRKTIVCNESIVLDVRTDTDEGIDSESSFSCRFHGDNMDEITIHASSGRNMVDVKVVRPTTFHVEECEESVLIQKDHRVSEVMMVCDNTKRQTALANENERELAGGSKATRRHTTHDAETMDETNAANGMNEQMEETHNAGRDITMNLTNNASRSNQESVEQSACLRRGEKIRRYTTNELEEMDASRTEQHPIAPATDLSRYSIYNPEHMDATDIENRQTDCEAVFVSSGEANWPDSKRPCKQTSQAAKQRSSTYDCADMDAIKNEDRSQRSRFHSEGDAKARMSSYELANMDDTGCLKSPQSIAAAHEPNSFYQTLVMNDTKMGDQDIPSDLAAQRANVTNYNAFLTNHEMSHGAGKHSERERLPSHHTECMHEVGLDSTRLSKEPERKASERAIKSRPSIYHVEEMDETCVATNHLSSNGSNNQSEIPTVEERSQLQSPALKSPRGQTVRHSVYHSEAMESTHPLAQAGSQIENCATGCMERPRESGIPTRRSKLRNIVQHTAVDDMTGFALLADDDDFPQQEPLKLDRQQIALDETVKDHRSRETFCCTDADGISDVTVKPSAPKYRPTVCMAEAIVEDTTTVQSWTPETTKAYTAEQNEPARMPVKTPPVRHSTLAPQRKSSVCMEETMLPIAVRVERRGTTFDKSPILCSAEHPPSLENTPRTEETMELTNAYTAYGRVHSGHHKSLDQTNIGGKRRQTTHQPSSMDVTLGPPETITKPGNGKAEAILASNRLTIRNSKPMEETPPHAGRTSTVGVRGLNSMPLEKTAAAIGMTQAQKRSEQSTGVMRKPRQTLLIALDMEVDEEVEMTPHASSPGVSLDDQSLLVRESTEDCVLRCAQPMAKSVLYNGGKNVQGSRDLYREPSVDGQSSTVQLSETLGGKTMCEPGDRYATVSSRFAPPASTVHELSDISMCNSTMRPELPQIGNITGMMSLHEITETLPPVPPLQEPNNSVSVICRVDHQQSVQEQQPFSGQISERPESRMLQQSLAFASLATQPMMEPASEDEFYDAEDGAPGAEESLEVDPLSLTKSRHLTMKFVDVEHLDRTKMGGKASVLVPSTTSKRVRAQLLCSPVYNRLIGEMDPLHVSSLPHETLRSAELNLQQTPQGPREKRPRTSSSRQLTRVATPPCIPLAMSADGTTDPLRIGMTESDVTQSLGEEVRTEQPEHHAIVKAESVEVDEEEEKEKRPTMERVGSQTIINDPSVFVIDDDDLLDDESNPPGPSFTEDVLTGEARESVKGTVVNGPGTSVQPVSVGKMKDLSFYRDFANITIDNLDSWDGVQGGKDDSVTHRGLPESAREKSTECISLSDDDSQNITPPKRTHKRRGVRSGGLAALFNFDARPSSAEVLDSTIASELMYEIRQQLPQPQNACCGTRTVECLCRPRRELERRKEACELVWRNYRAWSEALKLHIPELEHTQWQQGEGEPHRYRTLEEQIDDLNWRLMRAKLEQSSMDLDTINSAVQEGRSRLPPINGQFPETPSVVFLCENLQSYLSEQPVIDPSPPPGASLPTVPRITLLIANKLASDSGTRWQLDCSEETEGQLVLRHRTLRTVFISVQLQQRQEKGSKWKLEEDRRLERIQVRESQQEYVHTPKLLLAHIEFIRLAKETTERTLRSTYRTVASLMGLWRRFDELLRRVFDSVNRLLTITRNNDALLCYDPEMERFFVKKYFQRRLLDDGTIEPNMLTVHFNWIRSVCASGVSFKRPFVEAQKLLPSGSATNRGNGPTDDQTGLMFLECILWNVTKQFDT